MRSLETDIINVPPLQQSLGVTKIPLITWVENG